MRLCALLCSLLLLAGCHRGPPKDSDTDSGADSDTGEPPPERCPQSEGWAYVSAGISLACGVHTDGCAECWGLVGLHTTSDTGEFGYTRTGEDLPPDDSFATVAVVISYGSTYVMGNQACGVRTDASVTCWGRNDLGQADAPAGTFSMVDVFDQGSCGLRSDGGIVCWGDVGAPAPSGAYREISIGYPIGVAVDSSGDATSWLASELGGMDLPETRSGPFTSVSAGGAWVCGVMTDASLRCWEPGFPEFDEAYEALTPAGAFTSVSVGYDAACALQTDGHPVCFGRYPDLPEYRVPDATFTQISTGNGFVCGITTEQGVRCWGENRRGESNPPE